MGIIKLLDEEVSQLIAAGEVVERPSSVVKELVENSIDAGASKVTIEIRHGGVTMIRVSDNGSGIAPEDVPVMFLRHATSKVRTQEDLGHIATLGFRGEAMASIHAVARVEVLTRKQDSDEGVCYRGEGAQTGQVQPAGCPAGTTVKVQDLFYNTPARMKFLKKDVQEGNAVAAVVERIALSHPEISFQFIREGQTRLHTPGDGKLLSAVHAVFGREFTKDLAEVDYTQGQIHVSGLCHPALGQPLQPHHADLLCQRPLCQERHGAGGAGGGVQAFDHGRQVSGLRAQPLHPLHRDRHQRPPGQDRGALHQRTPGL